MNCKKLIYKKVNSKKPSVLLGIVVAEDNFLLKFRTAHNEYTISKGSIIEIRPTDEQFEVPNANN